MYFYAIIFLAGLTFGGTTECKMADGTSGESNRGEGGGTIKYQMTRQ